MVFSIATILNHCHAAQLSALLNATVAGGKERSRRMENFYDLPFA
jgi:hypothetical protein